MNIILLVSITLVAFSVAINADGPIKVTLSYIIAFALLIVSIMTVTLNWEAVAGKSAIEESNQPIVEQLPPLEEVPVDTTPQVKVKAKKPDNKAAIAKFMSKGKYWNEKGAHWAKTINGFSLDNLYDMSEDEYEKLVAEAKKYSSKATTVYNNIKVLKAPDASTKALKKKLKSAGAQLNLAGVKLVKFFNAENEDEEAKLEEEFISYSKKALTNFNRLGGSF